MGRKPIKAKTAAPAKGPEFWGLNKPPIYYSDKTLQMVVRKAAKAANQRLRRLEQSGYTAHAYAMAVKNLGGKTRFQERPKLDRAALNKEYYALRDFLSSKTSTPGGEKQLTDNRYEAARAQGFAGTREEWKAACERYFTKAQEGLFSSDVAYEAITNQNYDYLDAIIKDAQEHPLSTGQQILDLLEAKSRKQQAASAKVEKPKSKKSKKSKKRGRKK